jgi:alpha-aminoadipate carrier protein LysW
LERPVRGRSFIETRSTRKRLNEMAECPVCGAQVGTDSTVVEGELIECADCGTELEVTGTDPVTLEQAPEAEEDWGQ